VIFSDTAASLEIKVYRASLGVQLISDVANEWYHILDLINDAILIKEGWVMWN